MRITAYSTPEKRTFLFPVKRTLSFPDYRMRPTKRRICIIGNFRDIDSHFFVLKKWDLLYLKDALQCET